MNRQRKVLITVTYNDLGIIVDTKAEELDLFAQPNLQQTCNNLATDTISRQAAIDAILREYNKDDSDYPTDYQQGLSATKKIIEQLPSAQLIAFASPDNFTEPKFHPEDWREIL